MAKSNNEVLNLEVNSNIKSVTTDVDKLGKSLKKTTKESEDLGNSTKKGESGFRKVGLAVRSLGLALKSIGIGLIISAFVMLKEAFSKNQLVADTLKTALTSVTISLGKVVVVIVELVKWVMASESKFKSLGKVIKAFYTLALEPLIQAFNTTELASRGLHNAFLRIKRAFGADNLKAIQENEAAMLKLGKAVKTTGDLMLEAAKDLFNNWSDATDATSDLWKKLKDELSKLDFSKDWLKAAEITEADKAAQKALLTLEKETLALTKQMRLKKEIRDNEKNTFADRIKANTKLGELSKQQLEAQIKKLKVEERLAALKAESFDLLENDIALQKIQNEISKKQEEIAQKMLETNMQGLALEKELRLAKEQVVVEGMARNEKELEELRLAYVEKKKMATKSGMEITDIEKQYNHKRKLIIADHLSTQLAAFSGLSSGLSELAGDNKELAAASAIIDTYAGANKAFAQGGVLGYITAAGIIAAGLANVQKIYNENVGGGGGGSVGTEPQVPAPEMMSGAFTLGGGQAVEPARAYVVSDDITNNQNKLAIIRRRATI